MPLSLLLGGAPPFSSIWNGGDLGDWGTTFNWINGVPNGADAVADISSELNNSPNSDIDLLSPTTVGTIVFDVANTSNYNIVDKTGNGTGTLIFDVSAREANIINNSNGTQNAIVAPVVLDADLIIGGTGSSQLLFATAAPISGTGSILLNNLGGSFITIMNGPQNSFSGDLVLAVGTLQCDRENTLSPNSTLTMLGGTLDFNGFSQTIGGLAGNSSLPLGSITLTVNTTGTSNYKGVISGPGALKVGGTGVLQLTGVNTYMGPTTVNAGTLQVGAGGMISGSSAVTVNSGGILQVDGSITSSPVTVNSGAKLRGTGTVFSPVTILSGGVLSPGDSVGTLTIDTLTLDSGSTTRIEINSKKSSQVVINTSATVNGTLKIVPKKNVSYNHDHTYTILTGPYTGVFSGFDSTESQGFTFAPPFYFNNEIQLTLLSIGIPPQMMRGLKGNQKKLAHHLNKNAANKNAPVSAAFVSLVSLTGDAFNKALDSASPSRNALPIFAAQNLYFSLSEVVSSHLSQHRFLKELGSKNETLALQLFEESKEGPMDLLADASARSHFILHEKKKTAPQKPYAVWAGAFGENLHQDGRHQTPGFNAVSEAVFVAFDYYGLKQGMVGGTTGYAHTNLKDEHNMGNAYVNYYYGSVYGTVQYAPFYMDIALLGGYQDIDNKRHISYPGYHETAKARYHAWQLSPHLELGGDIDRSWGGLEPFVAFDFVGTWQEGFKEHGATGMNMKQKHHFSSMLRSALGLRVYENWTWKNGTFLLKEEVGYVNRKIFHTGDVTAVIVGGTGSLLVEALQPTQNLGTVGIEGLFAPTNSSYPQFSLGYFGEFGKGTQLNQVILKIIKEF